MAGDNEFERCPPDHPNRCQASGIGGQCPYFAKPGGVYCPRHAARSDKTNALAAANQFKLGIYQERVKELTTSSEIKNLRGEIGILRMTMETIVRRCSDDMELASYSGKIGDIIVKVQKLVQACQRLEIQMGMMLDRDKVMIIGQRIVEIIEKAVPNKELLDAISEEIVDVILKVSTE